MSWILNTTKIGTAPAAQPSSGWNGCTYGKFRSTEGQLGKQKRSPWLLILRLHSCVVSYAPVFDTTSPGGRATDLDRSWLHCVMGVSPPRGSLPAALLACGWDWAEVSLSLAESLRNSPPQAVLWTDGPARHLIWPSLIEGVSGSLAKPNEKCAGDFICSLCRTSTGGLGASSSVACPCSEGPVRKVSRWSDIHFSRCNEWHLIFSPHFLLQNF